jgi:RNA polymerase-binding transcription factor DksA
MPRAAKKAAPGSTGTRAAAPTPSRTGTSRSGAAGSNTTRGAAATTKKASTRVTSSPAKKAIVKKAIVKKAAAKATATQKVTAEKAVAKKAPAVKKAPAAKAAPAKKAVAKKAAAKPAKAESPFDRKFLEAQHALLNQERKRLVRDADSLTAEANSLAEGREPGDVQFDEESGEGDTLAVERERDLALSAQFRGQVEEIDRALAKFDLGTYGICEVSGTPIPKERLKAIPWARERVEYKVGGFGRR